VRRSFVVLMVIAVMAATMIGDASPAIAQPFTYCGPWHQEWHVSRSGWWYFWHWRWCHHPWGRWYVDWAGWEWHERAPGYAPGYYSGGPPPGY
jgi:hypothetical protein